MDKEIRKEALRQYFHYFWIWFVITGVVLLITVCAVVGVFAVKYLQRNDSAPAERVYDYADVMTDDEENRLRDLIAGCEEKYRFHIVVVTLNQEMGLSDQAWERNMMNFADDFYDQNGYGWDRKYGDGALLLDNWYEDGRGSQKGSWLSTSGRIEDCIGSWEEGNVFDAMDVYIDFSPFDAYCAAVEELCSYAGDGQTVTIDLTGLCVLFIIPFVVALAYALINLHQTKAQDTTTARTYVENGAPVVRSRTDAFIRKNVVSHRIESSSGGGGGGGRSGGGSSGHHVSSGGHSHGGGGRRR